MKVLNVVRHSLILFLILLSAHSIDAATITWNGGFGFWNQANRWSSGTVPGPNDQVIIGNGFVIVPNNFQVQVKGINVSTTSLFRIQPNAVVLLHNGDYGVPALENNGTTFNFGEIKINNYTGPETNSNVGLVNRNFFRNLSSGKIVITNTINDCLYNASSTTFINEGVIDIDVDFDIWADLIRNSGGFENRLTGTILIENGNVGINSSGINSNPATFENAGKIIIENPGGAAISASQSFKNLNSGTIAIQNGTMSISGSCHFENIGTLYISDYDATTNPSIYNTGYLENTGVISIDNVATGIRNGSPWTSTGLIDNHGSIVIQNTSDRSIFNMLSIVNFSDGQIETDGFLKGGDYLNMGVIRNTYNGTIHSINLTNQGIFNDKYGMLPSNAINTGVIVRPIPGPLSNGVPVNNVLDRGSNSNFIYGNWINKLWAGNVCGSYVSSANIFVPNIHAQGDTEIHVHIELPSSGLSDFFDIIVDNSGGNLKNESVVRSIDTREIMMFPNPTRGLINIEASDKFIEKTVVEVYTLNGELAFVKEIENSPSNFIMHLPENFVSGQYIIRITEGNQILFNKQMTLIE